MAEIANVGLSTGQFSNFQFTTNAENFITGITETSDTATVYPSLSTQTATYNNLNQLTDLSGQTLTYDLNGNLTSDGLRTYSWDAENRLVSISYPAQPGKLTTFSYDGLGRRTAIASTPAGGGSAVTTSYLWCGARICQARDAANSVTREYSAEGEFVPGSPAQSYYYGPDQTGSARRVFASTVSAPGYSYDPYGNALQSTAPVTDFNYAGMFYNTDSGLYLTQYRIYDPVAGRWLARDPVGEISDQKANLYPYVSGNPISFNDPTGQLSPVGAIVGGLLFGGLNLASQLAQNGGNIGCINPWDLAANVGLGILLGGAPELAPEVLAAERAAETTTLFRAVSNAEYADVIESGIFRSGGGSSYETGKFFAESGKDALQWGNALEGPGNFRVLQAEFPKSAADQFVRYSSLDGIGPARFGTFSQIGRTTIRLWPGSP